MLGSQFIAHPPKGEFEVSNAQPAHPLTRGIDSFTVEDELYLVEERGEIDVLPYSRYNGTAMRGFTESEYAVEERAAAIEHWARVMEVGPFFVLESVPYTSFLFRVAEL